MCKCLSKLVASSLPCGLRGGTGHLGPGDPCARGGRGLGCGRLSFAGLGSCGGDDGGADVLGRAGGG